MPVRKLPRLRLSKSALDNLYCEFVLLKDKIRNMKNHNTNQSLTLNAVLKFFGQAFKSLFESSHNREFKRLKDFIAS